MGKNVPVVNAPSSDGGEPGQAEEMEREYRRGYLDGFDAARKHADAVEAAGGSGRAVAGELLHQLTAVLRWRDAKWAPPGGRPSWLKRQGVELEYGAGAPGGNYGKPEPKPVLADTDRVLLDAARSFARALRLVGD